MPSVTGLIPATTMDRYKSFDEVSLEAKLYNAADHVQLICGSTNNCRVKMKWTYTPTIHGVRPPVLYHGAVANVYMNTKEAPRSKKAGELPVSIVLEGFRMDHESYLDEDTNLNRNTDHTVQGIVQTETRAVDANLEVIFNGVGKALYTNVTSQTCDING